MNSIKIIQISDVHIADEGVNPEGVDVRENLLKIVKSISHEEFDFLVLSGDLCYRETKLEIYQWIKFQLKSIKKPVYVISGNHDDSGLIANEFNLMRHLNGSELFYSINSKGKSFIFLDTGQGTMSDYQYEWLSKTIKKIKEENIYIFMHYPPVLANVPHMDNKWRFRQIDKFQQTITSYSGQFHIFCGHYHVESTIKYNNINIYITPSPFFNLKPDIEHFEVDNYLVGYRSILISESKVKTEVKYIE